MIARDKTGLALLGGALGLAAATGAFFVIRRFLGVAEPSFDDAHAEQALALGDLDGDPRTTGMAMEKLGIEANE